MTEGIVGLIELYRTANNTTQKCLYHWFQILRGLASDGAFPDAADLPSGRDTVVNITFIPCNVSFELRFPEFSVA